MLALADAIMVCEAAGLDVVIVVQSASATKTAVADVTDLFLLLIAGRRR
ncbi:MAG: hypothetical protein R2706_19895 [Acidimicrobiales bacterium]